MSITVDAAQNLKYGDMLSHTTLKNANGTALRLKVNGMPKIWKRHPDRIRVPLKRGLYEYGELTNGGWEGGRFTLFLDDVNLGSDN